MPKKYAKPLHNKRKPNARQQKFVKALAEGKTLTQAAKEANYSSKNPGQSGYQALAQLRGRIPELLERHGLGEEVLIDKYLKPLPEAEETKFFKDGKVRINVEALAIRHASLRTAFELMDPTRHEIPRRPHNTGSGLSGSTFPGQRTSSISSST